METKTSTPDDLLLHLQALEAELHHPGAPCSRARLEALLHPGFHEVGKSGLRYTRDTVIGFLASQASPTALSAHDHAVHRLGDDCALLTYESRHAGAAGTPEVRALRSSVWRRSAGAWQLFFHQGTVVAPPA